MWLPIHDWTEARVWAQIASSGAPVHPAYAAGYPRAGCLFCFYMKERGLQESARRFPELAAELRALEVETGHKFKHRLPIAKIIDDAEREPCGGDIENWIM